MVYSQELVNNDTMHKYEKMSREELIKEALKHPAQVETALVCKGKYGGLDYVHQSEGINLLSTSEIKNILTNIREED